MTQSLIGEKKNLWGSLIHKGSGIALMVEIMAAAMTGANFGYEDRSAAYPGAASSNAGQTLIVIEPAFSSPAPFASRIAGLIAQ